MALRLARLPVSAFYDAFGCGLLMRQPRRLCQTSSEEAKQPKLPATPPALDAAASTPSLAAPKTAVKSSCVAPPPPSRSATTPARQITETKDASSTSSSSEVVPSPTPKQKLSREVMRKNVKGYVFTRYIDYVKNYDRVLEKNFPSAVKVYRVFFDGVKEFYADMKRYLKISRIATDSPNGLKALNRQELELYMQMPRDMVKVAPALIGSSLPMVGYAIFPLVFMFPRTFLTTHFWSLQQRVEFQQLKLRERLNCNRAAFRCLQGKLKAVYKHERYCQLNAIFGQLGSGFHPNVQALLEVKDIFAKPPYSLLSLSGSHIKLLTQLHGLPGGWFKRHRLTEHAFILHHIDLAICREGGVHNMPTEAIRFSCFIRGLNPANLSNEEMIEWLRNWMTVSTSIQSEHISLFLHLPLFLGYNHPNNWQLIYCDGRPNRQQNVVTPSSQQLKQHQKHEYSFNLKHCLI